VPTTRDLGAHAEAQAARYLEHLGYRIVTRNYTVKGGEIDLVAAHGHTLCFVEVRARKDARHGTPQETVVHRKQRRVIAAARHYLATQVRGAPPACRFDVVAVEGETITLIPDAFQV
jgi:putative endonuclease